MRLRITWLFLAGLALAACETPESGTSSTTGTGTTTGSEAASPPPSQPSVASRTLPGQPRPGSQEDLVVNVGDRVFFDFDRYDLKPAARETVEKQAAWLEQNRGVTVVIEGHADERGTREYNLALGERRANSVRDYLVALGVDANRLKTISYGKERPVDPRSTTEAWEKNRRGVLVIE